jgi:membrane protease YdiL (CAAX protease family)
MSRTRSVTVGVSRGALVLVASCSLVFLRLSLLPAPQPTKVATLSVLYAGILGACLLVPARRERGRSILALGVGLVAVALVTVIVPRPVPLPFAPVALPLAVVAAIAEEALFRGVLFDGLRRRSDLVAVVGSAVVFAAIHVPLYGLAAFPLDLGAGLLFGWQRATAGSWHTPAITHVVSNVLGTLR